MVELDYGRLNAARERLEKHALTRPLIESQLFDGGPDSAAKLITDSQWNDEVHMRQMLKEHPHLMKMYEGYLKDYRECVRLQEKLDVVIESRRVDLQHAIDRFTDSQGMLRVRVTVVDELNGARGNYQPGTGEIRVLKQSFTKSGSFPPQLIKTIAHATPI